jgi:hypothetical protein
MNVSKESNTSVQETKVQKEAQARLRFVNFGKEINGRREGNQASEQI